MLSRGRFANLLLLIRLLAFAGKDKSSSFHKSTARMIAYNAVNSLEHSLATSSKKKATGSVAFFE
jgi:hypothetical protein